MSLKNIFIATGTPISTGCNIIRLSKMRLAENLTPDISDDSCADENFKPTFTYKPAADQVLSDEEKQHAIGLALSDATNCRKSLSKLVVESQLQMSTSTLNRVLSALAIHRRAPPSKPYLKDHQKQNRLNFARIYINLD